MAWFPALHRSHPSLPLRIVQQQQVVHRLTGLEDSGTLQELELELEPGFLQFTWEIGGFDRVGTNPLGGVPKVSEGQLVG